MIWDDATFLKHVKETLGENYTEEDATIVTDAIKRTKRIGARNYEQTICLMEKEIRELRNNNEILKRRLSAVQTRTVENTANKMKVTIEIEKI